MTTGNEKDRDLIKSLYRAILAREADDGGVDWNLSHFKPDDRDGSILHAVKAMLGSEEYKQRFHRARIENVAGVVLHVLGGERSVLVNGKPVKHVASLGTHCITSFLIKKYGLKRYSLPFDWTFSSPAAVVHCLEDDFKTYLDRSYYRSVTHTRDSREHGADHVFYLQNFGVKTMFAHRDPTLDADYRYAQDSVSRFRSLLESDDAKMFVMVADPKNDLGSYFDRIAKWIDSHTRNAVFLGIQLLPPTLQSGCHSIKLTKHLGMHRQYEFQPSSAEYGMDFEETIDDAAIIRLICEYQLEPATLDSLAAYR